MKTKLLIALTSTLIMTSCGSKNSQGPAAVAAPAVATPAVSAKPEVRDSVDGDWIVKEKTSRDGDVYFRSETLPAEKAEENARREYKDTQMKQVPVDPKYNAQLFRIEGPDSMNAVFIAPKIYAFTGNQTYKMEPFFDDENETMTLNFPVVFVDGLNPEIEASKLSNAPVKLPDIMLVKDVAGLEKWINMHYAKAGVQNLASLPGCPKNIIITIAGKEYEAIKTYLNKGDYCQYNKPLTVSVTLPKKTGVWLLQKGLYSGAAKISSVFETRVPYLVSRLRIEMNKAKLYEEIAAKVQVNHPYAEVDLSTEIKDIVKNQALKISIQGDLTAPILNIVNQAIATFFEKMPPDPQSANLKCRSSSVTCLKISYKKLDYNEKFSVDWTQTSDVLSGQNILTWTGLTSLSDDIVKFDSFKNDGLKITTGITLHEGSMLELQIDKVLEEQLSQVVSNNSTTTKIPVGPKPTCLAAHEGPGAADGRGATRDGCNREQQYATQNNDLITYKLEKKVLDIPEPYGKVDEILNNITLEFQWSENGKTKVLQCEANRFIREGDGQKILLVITNVPGCEVFTKNSTNKPMLYLINTSEKEVVGKEGIIRKVNGKEVQNTVKEVPFKLKSTYVGLIMKRGSSIGTDVDLRPNVVQLNNK